MLEVQEFWRLADLGTRDSRPGATGAGDEGAERVKTGDSGGFSVIIVDSRLSGPPPQQKL